MRGSCSRATTSFTPILQEPESAASSPLSRPLLQWGKGTHAGLRFLSRSFEPCSSAPAPGGAAPSPQHSPPHGGRGSALRSSLPTLCKEKSPGNIPGLDSDTQREQCGLPLFDDDAFVPRSDPLLDHDTRRRTVVEVLTNNNTIAWRRRQTRVFPDGHMSVRMISDRDLLGIRCGRSCQYKSRCSC